MSQAIIEHDQALSTARNSLANFNQEISTAHKSLADFLTPKPVSDEELESRIMKAMSMTALASVGKKAKDYYGEVLECRNVVIDDEERTMLLPGKGPIKITKVSWNVREKGDSTWFWVDTFTKSCLAYAEALEESLGEGPWSIYWPVSFVGQSTKWHKDDGLLTDSVVTPG